MNSLMFKNRIVRNCTKTVFVLLLQSCMTCFRSSVKKKQFKKEKKSTSIFVTTRHKDVSSSQWFERYIRFLSRIDYQVELTIEFALSSRAMRSVRSLLTSQIRKTDAELIADLEVRSEQDSQFVWMIRRFLLYHLIDYKSYEI